MGTDCMRLLKKRSRYVDSYLQRGGLKDEEIFQCLIGVDARRIVGEEKRGAEEANATLLHAFLALRP